MKAITVPARRIALDLTIPCKPWTGWVTRDGYGKVTIDGDEKYAHRLTYQLLVGPIPRGWEVDHVCHSAAISAGVCEPGPCAHRSCCEPAHLEAVTSRENSLRGGHPLFSVARSATCGRGHDMNDPDNVYIRADGRRRCRGCARINQQRRRECAR